MNWREREIAELEELCEKHPKSIPIKEAAEFLTWKPNKLREYLMEHPNNPFGIGVSGEGNRYNRIATLAFHSWLLKNH